MSRPAELPPELAALPEKARAGVIALALELVRGAIEPLPGLTRQQTMLVRAVQAVSPRIAPYETLAHAISPSTWAGDETRSPVQVHVVLHHVRKRAPELGRHLHVEHGLGLRWSE